MSALKVSGLLIIADDLSGAADCAAGFAMRLPTAVLLNATDSDAAVLAIDVDSRRLAAQAAAAANSAVLTDARFAGRALYKKIDSTLRGNVASEVAALQALRGLALVAPAFPTMGRSTENGLQLLDGVPVEQSEVWRNEHLTGTGDLVASLSAQGLRCAALNLATVRNSLALQQALHEALHDGTQALICDAVTDADLHGLAVASAPLHQQLFWVGSAGLAAHLASALGMPEPVSRSITLTVQARSAVLTVVGSMSLHSQRQAEVLAEHSACFCLELDAATLLAADAGPQREQWFSLLSQQLASGRDCLLTLSQQARNPALAASLSNALAQWLKPALPLAGSLIATGGETARAILGAAGISQLQVRGELAPGVVLCATESGLDVVTKAGAFGQPDSLLRAWQQLHGHSADAVDHAHNQKEIHHV